MIIQRMPEGFSTDVYDAVNERANVLGDPPDGLIFHSLGVSDDGMVILDVWESREQFESFRKGRLNPALEGVVGTEVFAGMPEPDRQFYETHSVFAT